MNILLNVLGHKYMAISREYHLRSGGKVILSISVPKRTLNGNYTCELKTRGLQSELSMLTHGADSMQPLLAAIAIANARIKSTSEYVLGDLSWPGELFEGDIGLLEHSQTS